MSLMTKRPCRGSHRARIADEPSICLLRVVHNHLCPSRSSLPTAVSRYARLPRLKISRNDRNPIFPGLSNDWLSSPRRQQSSLSLLVSVSTGTCSCPSIGVNQSPGFDSTMTHLIENESTLGQMPSAIAYVSRFIDDRRAAKRSSIRL